MARINLSRYQKVYRLLLKNYGRNWHVRISFIMAVVSRTAKFVALPIAASQLIAGLATQDFEQARQMVLVFAAFSALIGILSPLTKYVALLGENDVYADSMKSYFNALLDRDVKYFNEGMTGYITSAARQYSDNTLQLIRKLRDSYISIVFSMIIPIIVIGFVDLLLGFVILLLGGVQAIYLVWASHRIAPFRTKSREMYKYVSGLMSDAVTNIIAIKSTAQEDAISKRVGDNMKKESRLFIARYKAQVKLIAFREVITVTFFLSLFWITVGRMSSGMIDIAGAVLVISYAFTIMTAIYDLSDALDEHDDFVDQIIPMFELLEEANTILDPEHPYALESVPGNVELKNISFSYTEVSGSVPVFKNLSLKIPAGQKIGIVGLSGAGKSTLAKLLLRFEDVESGEILIDSIQITSVKQSDLRRNIAYVPQEPLLFHSSIAENIRLAKLDATDDEILQAAESAYALNFVQALPNGFDSIVGERGVKLSGGQKQRIAIARAVLQNAPIIVLDEATSALDSESEQIIKESFTKILKGKTAVVIAHRLSTLSNMNRIILLHEGEIIEDGTHTQLLDKNGIYAKLWRHQRQHPEELEVLDVRLDKV